MVPGASPNVSLSQNTNWLVTHDPDGRVLIIAEGEESDLERFAKALVIQNTIINVTGIEKEYKAATGEYKSFAKLVESGETDSRLDAAVDQLKALIFVTKEGVNVSREILAVTLENLAVGKETLAVSKSGFNEVNSKLDCMLSKQELMISKQDLQLDKTDLTHEGFDLVSNSSALNSCVNIFNIYSRFGTNTTSI